MASTVDSYSSSEAKTGGGPADGQRDQFWYRQLAYPVSSPSNGEFAVRASNAGSHGRAWLITCTPRARSGMSMCTWHPHVAPSRAVAPKCSAIRS